MSTARQIEDHGSLERTVLEHAAACWQIELEYIDTWGNRHTASSEAIRAVLQAFGVPTGSTPALAAAIGEREREAWTKPFPSCLVVYEDAGTLELRVPEAAASGSIKLELEWDNGDLQHHWFFLPELPQVDRAEFRDASGQGQTAPEVPGEVFLAKRVPLPSLRLGYHRLRVYWVKAPELECFGEAHFIVCPRRVQTLQDRMAGVALCLYGLRSSRNWGIGDFTDLVAVIDQFAPAGAAFLALNPLHAIANREPYNTSPYLPECSLYRNYLYLDVERVPGFAALGASEAAERDALRATPFVEYERVAQLKLKCLRQAFDRFQASRGQQVLNPQDPSDDFAQYVEAEGAHLQDYAVYCALWEHIHQNNPDIWLWTDWPEAYRDPRGPDVIRFAEQHPRAVLFYKFLQWQVDRQLAAAQGHAIATGMKLGLYHDLALATDRFGADLWAFRDYYATGARVGAPPDELGPAGQDWGFPPPDREAHRSSGYQWFARLIRNTARHGGVLRIDHVMRFFRLFWIPEGLEARDGLYVRDYVEDLLGILALESARGGFIVIGEDLGTVAPEVRSRLTEAGILGYRLLWFEKHRDGTLLAPHEYAEHAAVSTTTHDLPTLAGFFAGRDIEARKAAGLVDEAVYEQQWAARREDIRRIEESLAEAGFPHDAMAYVLATPASVAIINQEDLTGETEQQNLPGTTWEHPNWRRKMLVAVEDFAPLAVELRRKLEQAGRLPADSAAA